MTDPIVHNLDQDYAESFDFIVQGHTYRCRYVSAEEIEKIQKSVKDDPNSVDVLKEFISPVGDAPAFEIIWKKMRIPQIKAFVAMLQEEFGMNA